MFEYFTREEADLFTFYRVPKELHTNPKYRKILSSDAKHLYGMLLDRNSLSLKNSWFDNKGHVYIYFSREEAMEILDIKTEKVVKLFAELKEAELIREIRQGLGKPNRIYLGKFIPSTPEKSQQNIENNKNFENRNTDVSKIGNQKLRESKCNKTEGIYTYGERLTHTQPSSENRTQELEKTEKNIVCVKDVLPQKKETVEVLQKEIKKVTGYQIAIKKVEELLANSSVACIQHHLANWETHKQYQKSEGAGWLITVIENDIAPEKKKAGGTGKENGKRAFDNFEEREYTKEQCQKWENALIDELLSQQEEPQNYTYITEGEKQ